MIHATRRGVRRSTASGRQGFGKTSLMSFLQALGEAKRPASLDGYPRGARVAIARMDGPGAVMYTFRHPTKKATSGRYAFLSVAKAIAREREVEVERVRT